MCLKIHDLLLIRLKLLGLTVYAVLFFIQVMSGNNNKRSSVRSSATNSKQMRVNFEESGSEESVISLAASNSQFQDDTELKDVGEGFRALGKNASNKAGDGTRFSASLPVGAVFFKPAGSNEWIKGRFIKFSNDRRHVEVTDGRNIEDKYLLPAKDVVALSSISVGIPVSFRSSRFGDDKVIHRVEKTWMNGISEVTVMGGHKYYLRDIILQDTFVGFLVGEGMGTYFEDRRQPRKLIKPVRRYSISGRWCGICNTTMTKFYSCAQCSKTVCDSCYLSACRLTPNKFCPFCRTDNFFI